MQAKLRVCESLLAATAEHVPPFVFAPPVELALLGAAARVGGDLPTVVGWGGSAAGEEEEEAAAQTSMEEEEESRASASQSWWSSVGGIRGEPWTPAFVMSCCR